MSVFVCGTDTGVGKTHVSALLLREFPKAHYWKPIQTGFPPDDDAQTVVDLISPVRDINKNQTTISFQFKEPLSPHRAAELESTEVSLKELVHIFENLQNQNPHLIVEGAGGLLVPINRTTTWIDFLRETKLPVVLVARSGLGTINHTLLTIHMLRHASLTLFGIYFTGPENPDNMQTIQEFSDARILGNWNKETTPFSQAKIVKSGLNLHT